MKTHLLVGVFFFFFLFSTGYSLYRTQLGTCINVDCEDYMQMAQGNYQVSPIRKFRWVVPTLAASVASLPYAFDGNDTAEKNKDTYLRLGFFLINTLIMALFGLCLYLLCQHYTNHFWISIVSTLVTLSSRWAIQAGALPITDSLFLLCVAAGMWATLSNSFWVLALSIIFGCLAKESYILFVPILLWQSKMNIKYKMATMLGVVCTMLSSRNIINHYTGDAYTQGIAESANHLHHIWPSVQRLFSLQGAADMLSVFGFFGPACMLLFIPLVRQNRISIYSVLNNVLIWAMLGVVLVHMLLSYDIGRMAYASAPVFAVFLSITASEWQKEIGKKGV